MANKISKKSNPKHMGQFFQKISYFEILIVLGSAILIFLGLWLKEMTFIFIAGIGTGIVYTIQIMKRILVPKMKEHFIELLKKKGIEVKEI